jgi:hypothetical protein
LDGPLPAAEVAGRYRAANAFALASVLEPYSTVYSEAMAVRSLRAVLA